jgi:hypothetical protein
MIHAAMSVEDRCRRVFGTILVGSLGLLWGCGENREPAVYATLVIDETEEPLVTQENLARISEGMTQKEMREVLGNPSAPRIVDPEPGDLYELCWEQGIRRIRVRIRDDKVIAKEIEEIR